MQTGPAYPQEVAGTGSDDHASGEGGSPDRLGDLIGGLPQPAERPGRVSIDAQDAGRADAHAPVGPASPSRDVLGLFEGPHYSYELSIERCERPPEQTFRGNPECPFHVRLMEAGKAVDSVALPETACGPPRPMKVDRAFGTAPEARAWITGTEACHVGVAAMTVAISDRDLALLVTQRIGWERVARRHVLYRVDQGKVRSVWSADEGLSSSSITSVSVLAVAGAPSQDVAFIRVQLSDDEVAESLVATALALGSRSRPRSSRARCPTWCRRCMCGRSGLSGPWRRRGRRACAWARAASAITTSCPCGCCRAGPAAASCWRWCLQPAGR